MIYIIRVKILTI